MKYLLVLLSLLFFSCSHTFYIVRHAEKEKPGISMAEMQANNPPLSCAGQLRAVQLKDLLKNKNIKHIFSTNTIRTVTTALPLSEHRLIPVQIYSGEKDSLDTFIKRLKSIRKGNVLVTGHSHTIADIANTLCGRIVVFRSIQDNEYNNLFMIRQKGKRYTFKWKKYGK